LTINTVTQTDSSHWLTLNELVLSTRCWRSDLRKADYGERRFPPE